MEQFTGKVWILGDDIDTDIIIPTEYLALPTVEDMKQYGFSPLRPELASQIQEGDIIDIDIDKGTLTLEVSDEELAARREAWVKPEPKYQVGVLARYAKLVSSADKGAYFG